MIGDTLYLQTGAVIYPSQSMNIGYATWAGIDAPSTGYMNLGTSSSIGSGPANTAALMNIGGYFDNCLTQNHNSWNPSAACHCDQLVLNGYNDWYLPPIDELNILYNNLYVLVI